MNIDNDIFNAEDPDNPGAAMLVEALRAVREALTRVDGALAAAMVAMAETDCRRAQGGETCLQAVAWARDVFADTLHDLSALPATETAEGAAGRAERYPGAGLPPTLRQVAKRAAHLIAAVSEARLDEDELPLIVRDALEALRKDCEAAGLMAPYVFPGHPSYRVLD